MSKKIHRARFCKIRFDRWVCLFVVLATILVFYQVIDHSFIDYDDDVYVTKNANVQAGLTWDGLIWSFTTFHGGNWHPLTWLSHMLDIQIFGMDAGLHHLINLVFHIANAVLLFFLLNRLTGKLWSSAVVAALFALHPLHVESVVWLAERKDLLRTFFWLLTLFCYALYAENPNLKRYLAVLLFFILGLMAKPMLVTLPFVLCLLDYWPLGRFKIDPSGKVFVIAFKKGTAGRLALEKLPLFFLAGASCVVTYMAQKEGGAVGSLEVYPFYQRAAGALVAYALYIKKMIWPADLSFLYPFRDVLPLWQIVGAGLLIASISFVSIRSTKCRPWLFVGWFWYLGTLIPVIGLVKVGWHSMADRYTYVPLIGLFIAVTWEGAAIFQKWPLKKYKVAMITAAILSVLMLTTWSQVGQWKTSITLYEHALEVNPENYVAHNNLGLILADQGKTREAIRHYFKALRVKPMYAHANNNLGTALIQLGKFDEAEVFIKEALKADPYYAEAYSNLGVVLVYREKIDEAAKLFRKALQIKPHYRSAYNNLNRVLALPEQ